MASASICRSWSTKTCLPTSTHTPHAALGDQRIQTPKSITAASSTSKHIFSAIALASGTRTIRFPAMNFRNRSTSATSSRGCLMHGFRISELSSKVPTLPLRPKTQNAGSCITSAEEQSSRCLRSFTRIGQSGTTAGPPIELSQIPTTHGALHRSPPPSRCAKLSSRLGAPPCPRPPPARSN